jgi:hypothetical protein
VYLKCVTKDGEWIGASDLLTTCIHHLELHFTDRRHTQTSIHSTLQSPLAVSWQRLLPKEVLQLPALRSSCHSNLFRTLCQLTTQLTRSPVGSHSTPPNLVSSSHSHNQLLHVTSLKLLTTLTPNSSDPAYNILAQTTQKTPFFYCSIGICCRGNVFTETLLRNGLHNPMVLLLQALPSNCFYTHRHCLAMGLYATLLPS